MLNRIFTLSSVAVLALMTSCKKDDAGPSVKPYTVPLTYSFIKTPGYSKSSSRVYMAVELDNYLKIANAGSSVVALDQAKVDNMFTNTGSPFLNPALNTAGVNLKEAISDAPLYKSLADSVLIYNTGTSAADGTGGFVPRNANKIIVGPDGLEYGQAFLKGIMGSLFLKEAVKLLSEVKTLSATDTVTAQAKWDEAYGNLGVPDTYDSSVVYLDTDPERPLIWGDYLGERGNTIQAGGTIFGAFLKGRAAIGAYDVTVRNAQADIILAKWEQLCAVSALYYVTSPTVSANIGNYGSQLHGLSEGFGFITSLRYRAAESKLKAADFETLNTIIHKSFYVLLNQPGFTDLVTAQNILKTTYGL